MNQPNIILVGGFYLYHAKSGTTKHVNAVADIYYEWDWDKGKYLLMVTVLEGSRAAKTAQPSLLKHQLYYKIRKELIGKGNGTLADHGDSYVFTKDNTFESPSAASCVTRADSSNGLLQWRRVSDGKALGEILRYLREDDAAAA